MVHTAGLYERLWCAIPVFVVDSAYFPARGTYTFVSASPVGLDEDIWCIPLGGVLIIMAKVAVIHNLVAPVIRFGVVLSIPPFDVVHLSGARFVPC